MHFGILTPPVPGHIHPFGALGRELIERGHQVTVFHMPDLEDRVRAEGLAFIPIGQQDYPKGSLPLSLANLGRRKGFSALRFTIQEVAKTTAMMLRDAPDAIRRSGISMLLVDQTEPAGATIADRLGLPYVTICNAMALNREPDVPPPFSPWSYRVAAWARVRNRVGYAVGDRITYPIRKIVDSYRTDWKLPPYRSTEDSFSPLAQISQQPALFDFPRRRLPSTFHYVGPFRKPSDRRVPFPWGRLDGRPLIYASLGTLQNRRLNVFESFAEACVGLEAQLVISHGGGLSEHEAASLPGNPLTVNYAPQTELMARARLTLTHAGLNTVLDSLSYGVPLVAIPLTYEQPAIAERVRYTAAGIVLPFAKLTPGRLRDRISRVLFTDSYTAGAIRLRDSIRSAGGVVTAADLILSLR